MPKNQPIPMVGGAYLSRSRVLDAQRCVNFFPVLGESGNAKSVRALFGTPGLRKLATLAGTGGIRALYRLSTGAALAVRGSSLYWLAADWTSTYIGEIDTGTAPVSIADDGTVAVLVSGRYGWSLNLATSVLSPITDDAFYGADYVYWTKTVFVFNRPSTEQFYITTGDGVAFDPLDFASATSNAEPLIRHTVNHEELVLFKRTTIEIWRAVAGGDFLFARDVNAAIEKGCQAKHSVAELDSTLYWLGGDADGEGIVWRLDGYTPRRVSHDGLEFAIQNYGDVSDARAYAYQQEGHSFYVLTFPTARATWVYDPATGLWHERAYRNPTSAAFDRHRSNCHMLFNNTHVVGDWEDGRIYALDLDYFTDDGDPLVSLRACPHLASAGYTELRYNRLRVDMETGIGNATGDGSDPQMMLRWSNDGGRTWTALKNCALGRIGEYGRRVSVDRLGMGRDRVFEVSIADPVRRVLLGAAIDFEDTGR